MNDTPVPIGDSHVPDKVLQELMAAFSTDSPACGARSRRSGTRGAKVRRSRTSFGSTGSCRADSRGPSGRTHSGRHDDTARTERLTTQPPNG